MSEFAYSHENGLVSEIKLVILTPEFLQNFITNVVNIVIKTYQ